MSKSLAGDSYLFQSSMGPTTPPSPRGLTLIGAQNLLSVQNMMTRGQNSFQKYKSTYYRDSIEK